MSRRGRRKRRKNTTVITEPKPRELAAKIGVIVIGRNEGDRLERCLKSIEPYRLPTCYVDSGSSDGSVELAERLGVETVSLSDALPFTAARARNEGWNRLQSMAPDIEYVQLLDGDTELQPNWLEAGIAAIAEDQRIAAVSGRRRERLPDASIFNRLCDIEWNTPVGEADAFGGDVLIRTKAWQDARGYDVTMIAGEDPEFGMRLRAGGWTIHRIDAEMTLHDADLQTFGQWWTRTMRRGHGLAEAHAMHGRLGLHRAQVRSVLLWGGLLPSAVIASLLVGGLVTPWALLGTLACGAYAWRWSKIRAERRDLGDNAELAATYASHTILGTFAEMVGLLRYRWSQIRGNRPKPIEPKNA